MEEVIYKEDAILALVQHFVEPVVLQHRNHASIDLQLRVANQMYAAVVLYNYYLRKQFQHLEFVNWEYFCKVSAVACSQLMKYVKYTKNPLKLKSKFDHYATMTEKRVKEACETCEALDPTSTGWVELKERPVAKVAAFVVDSSCRNCILVYGAMTEDVFSIIEQEIDRSSEHGKLSAAMQYAYLAVKDQTGINQSSLRVADTSVVYSVTKKMTTCQLYIMQCVKETTLKPNDNNLQVEWVSISELLNSVQRSVVDLNSQDSVTIEVSTSTKYLHLWPYWDFIREWLRKNDIHVRLEQPYKSYNEKGRVTEHSTVEEIAGDSRKNIIEDNNCALVVNEGRLQQNANSLCSNGEERITLVSAFHTRNEDCLVEHNPNSEERTLSMSESAKKRKRMEEDTWEGEGREDNIVGLNETSQRANNMNQQVFFVPEGTMDGSLNETSQRANQMTQQVFFVPEDTMDGSLNEASQRANKMTQQVFFVPEDTMDGSKNNAACASETSQRIQENTQHTLEHVQCTNKFGEKSCMRCLTTSLLPWQEKTTQFLRNIVQGKTEIVSCCVGGRDCGSTICATSNCNVACEQTVTELLEPEAEVMHNFEEGIHNLSCSTKELEKLCKRNKWSINYVINKAGTPDSGLVTATLVIEGFGFQLRKISRPTRDKTQAKHLAASLMLGYFYSHQGTMHSD